MGKQVPKMSARVVHAIRNLREAHGSTSKEIMNYITSQYSAPESIIQRQMQAALKRGLDYGILKKNNGHYFLNTDVDMQQLVSNLEPVERSRRRRRSSRRRRRKRSRGRRRRRSRRRRSRRRYRRRGAKMRRMGCTNCRCRAKKARDAQILEDDSIEPAVPDEDMCVCDNDSDAEHRSRHSNSRDPSLSRSRSLDNSDRDAGKEREAIRDQD
ncbi:uncharacterized protein LOC143188344 [Calliopsis andreniformis]|uniref:uncharacterized protein LOC143188344 n=1 Tax=Calliopsis andreniformis TaxID=337506 RepID=UPI003FCE4F31